MLLRRDRRGSAGANHVEIILDVGAFWHKRYRDSRLSPVETGEVARLPGMPSIPDVAVLNLEDDDPKVAVIGNVNGEEIHEGAAHLAFSCQHGRRDSGPQSSLMVLLEDDQRAPPSTVTALLEADQRAGKLQEAQTPKGPSKHRDCAARG